MAANETSSAQSRVIPSGKVYRQIFDAEVQLNKALEQTEQHRSAKRDGLQTAESGVPVVRAAGDTAGKGMLNDRQLTWMDSFPNEPHVENPVLHKYVTEEVQEQHMEPESSMAMKEVRGLPDVLTPAKTGSDIIERIAESRRERHESAIEDMHQELGIISSELEPRIQEAGEILMAAFGADDVDIEAVLARIANDEDLINYSLGELHDLWDEIPKHSVVRQEAIVALDEALQQVEHDRIEMVREVFRSYADNLEKIAHMMQPDLQRLLDKETQVINQTVLGNRRAYADLYSRLLMSDIDRERRQQVQWRKRVDDWRRLHTEAAVSKFKEYMASQAVTEPPGVHKVLEFMHKEQQTLNQRRMDLVGSLRDLKPPASTKTAIYNWNTQLTELSKQIDTLNQDYFNRLCGEYESVCQACLEEVDMLKADLVERGVATEQQAQEVVNEQCLPLVGDRQAIFEQTMEAMDRQLEEHNATVLTDLKSLFKFSQGSAHVWDVHEIGLAKQERHLQEKLDECRHSHDNINQDKEANLDILMDRMRQEASEAALADSLKKALEMLTKIKDGYEVFHKDQLDIVATYPEMVTEELGNYDKAVCKFFSVDRTHPDDKKEEPVEEAGEETSRTSTPKSGRSSGKSRRKVKRSTSRSSSRGSQVGSQGRASPVQFAVSEVLNTTNGTTFYVLKVAGEHGVTAAEGEGQEGQGQGQGQAFLTQGEEPQGAETEARPAYVTAVDVPNTFIQEIKRQIRQNFLEQLEAWRDQAVDRSHSVVAAKTEELNSELDLRLHLHNPRPRRAELDVHNVRAAELVMHSERVSRHCKGVTQALTDLKTRFNAMTQEHNGLADKFRADIEALEVVFINATKSSKLVALSNQLQVEKDRYMEVIRSSLRQFRQHLDDTLQMLRESNARFIKSFKLFSDGGNFCPEEIDDYRKKLEKLSQKIDSSEGFIMADLEGMESRRLDQASKVAAEFEDRFKHHMVDLVFMEKIARWLTNTQVKIKAEVANSNSQAQALTKALADLDRRIDACERPNLDKEAVSPTQLSDGVRPLCESFHSRAVYLNCVKGGSSRPSSAALQGNPALGARVGFTGEAAMNSMPSQVSRPGKQPVEDPSVPVIRHILKTQKARFGMDSSDGDLDKNMKGKLDLGDAESREKTHSRKSRPGTDGSKKGSRQGTATASNDGSLPKRTQSGLRRTSKGSRFDKKYMVFGEKGEDEAEDSHFLGKIRHICREALDGLLSAAELYYRQKGSRPVTRPQALQEAFEMCADVVVQKLQSYFKQADEYHNQCLQEFRQQLSSLEDGIARVPRCVIRELTKKALDEATRERAQLDKEFDIKLSAWENSKIEHQNLLRPTLGHPQADEDLADLNTQEEARRTEYLEGVATHTKQLQEVALKHAKKFVDRLAGCTEGMLVEHDGLLTVDDVERGRVPPTKYPTSELIRRKNTGASLEDGEEKANLPRGKATWTGLPLNELSVPGLVEKSDTTLSKAEMRKNKRERERKPTSTASVTTAKTTLAHSATVEARDAAYKDYKQEFEACLTSIDKARQKHEIAEQRWTDSWHTSVDRVKQLY